MTTLSAAHALAAVKDSAEKIKNDAPQRFPEAASPGDTWRQGDVYIERLESVPAQCQPVKQPDAQLAPGTSQGSRHTLDSLAGVTLYQRPRPTVLDGPILEVAVERTITHPEHGDVVLPPGVYAIAYQRAYAAELRRQAD